MMRHCFSPLLLTASALLCSCLLNSDEFEELSLSSEEETSSFAAGNDTIPDCKVMADVPCEGEVIPNEIKPVWEVSSISSSSSSLTLIPISKPDPGPCEVSPVLLISKPDESSVDDVIIPILTPVPSTDARDGQTYKVVAIGDQIWMAQNLNYNASGSKCYNNDTINCATYGRLYNLKTAKTACPSGWHLPSFAEWTVLINYVGEQYGKKLKTIDGWKDHGNGTDDYGFSISPAGYGAINGNFLDIGASTTFWYSEGGNSDKSISLNYQNNIFGFNIDIHNNPNANLNSVRCVMD